MKQYFGLALGAMLLFTTGCVNMNRCGQGYGCAETHVQPCGTAGCHGGCDICSHCKSCGTQGHLPDMFSFFRSWNWCRPCFLGCWGCGERYYGDWYSDPHSSCESCDGHGNWTGAPRGQYQPAHILQSSTPEEVIVEEQGSPVTVNSATAAPKVGYGRSNGYAGRTAPGLFPWLRTARYGLPRTAPQQRF